MPLITRSSSKSSSDGGGDNPSAVAARLLFRRSDSASVLPDESLDQRDVFTFTSDNEEMIGSSSSTTPRCSNKSSRAIISSSDEAFAETTLASNNKRRKISDDASSSRDDPSCSTNNISHPGPNDVMYGRGGATNAHIGNKKFRCIVESLKSKYLHAPRNEKSEIAMDAVALWRRFDPPGRFLKQNEQEQSSCEDEETNGADGGTWYDVGIAEARKKTSQMLRDAANPSAANYVKLFGRYEAELLQVCIEYLQGKSPGSGEVVDPLVLLSQMKSRKKMKQQKIPSGVQQFRLTSTATSSYPTQSLRGVSKPSPGSIAHQLPSELELQHLHMSIPSNLEENPPKKQQSLTPKVVGEIFASLDSNKGCKHDFSIILLPEIEKTIMPPFLQYSEGTYLFLRPNVVIPPVLSNRKLTEHELSTSMRECKWTMTGPQAVGEYPTRYMTPKVESHGYNADTRGVLYSRKDQDGNDDTDVKILHIYRSERVSRRGKHPVALPQDAQPKAHSSKTKKSGRLSKQKKVKISVPHEDSLQDLPGSKKHFRQAWSEVEDCQLRQLVEGFTSLNQRIKWVQVSNEMPGRSGKQCRERWLYQLQPGLKREEFTPEEDALLYRLVETMGTKWSEIQKKMPGRTDMDAKNRMNFLERARKRQERNGTLSNNRQNIHQIDNVAGGQKMSAGTDALISLCNVALAKEQEESIERSMDSGDTSTEGSVWSDSPEVGMRVRVRFEDDDGDYTFYGGTITNISSELQDMAAAMDIDGLANAVANGAYPSSSEQSYHPIGNIDASVAHQSKITIKYDDGSTEECSFPDPDIQLVASNLSEEEMSLSNELLNLNVSLSLQDLHKETKKRKYLPAASDVKSSVHHSDCVPLETVRGLLLGDLDPIELASRLLSSEEVVLVRKKWRKSETEDKATILIQPLFIYGSLHLQARHNTSTLRPIVKMSSTDQMDGLPVVSKLYLSSSCPELKAESVISDFSDTEEILSEIERVVTPPIQEEQEEFIIESTTLPSPLPLSRIGLPTTTATSGGLAIPTALPSSSPLSSRRSLEWQFKGLTVWLELEEFDNDLTRAVEYFSSKHNSPFIPQSHTTAIYGMEHLSIEEARARLRTVRDLIPQWPTFAKPTGITSDIAQCGRPGQVCDIAWSELTLATNPQHEAALDILYELFYGSVYHRDRPWKPHNSVAYDNPETNHLSLLDTIMYASQNPSLLGMERRVAAIALWSTVGKMGDWECLERVRFID